MKIILAILLFSFSANAQIVRCNSFYRPTAINLFLDLYPSSNRAFSLRKLNTSYNGSCIRVRRSNDNAEQNIGFVNNYLDTASLKTFVGANNGFVTTWYDQSTNANDLTQTTASSQPQIVASGVINRQGGIACINTANNTFLQSATTFNTAPQTWIAAIGSHTNTATDFFGNRSAATGWLYGYRTTPSYLFACLGTGGTNASVSLSQQTKHLAFMTRASTTITTYINSTNSGTNTTTYTNSSLNLAVGRGGLGTSTNFANANIFEVIGYLSDQSTNRAGMENNVNSFYSLY